MEPMILILDREQKIVHCSRNCGEKFGIDVEEIAGNPLSRFFTTRSCRLLDGPFLDDRDFCVDLVLSNGNGMGSPQRFTVTPPGEKKPLFILASLPDPPPSAIKEMKEEPVFKRIVETAPLGIFTMDRDGKIMEINIRVAEILGSPSLEATKNINTLTFPPIVESGIAADFIRCFESGKVINAEREYMSKWGKKLFLRYNCAPLLKKGGKVAKILVIFEDITSLKKAGEEQEAYRSILEEGIRTRTEELTETTQKLREEMEFRYQAEKELLKSGRIESLGIFAGGIAHDFNNLLTAILGNISLARQNMTEDNQNAPLLREAENASLQARVLTQQLLTFSKGGSPIKKTSSIQDLLIDTAYFVLSGSHVKCDFFINPGLWNVTIDSGQIGQVIHNLVINARQSMEAPGVITITAENVSAGMGMNLPMKKGDYVRISIRDQGTGISEEDIHHIFDPYFTTKRDGTGLGLSISYSIIKRHDGFITVDTSRGNGTTFHVYLPATKENVDRPENKEPNDSTPRGGRILVMDDEEMVLMVVQRILSHLGYEVQCVKEGEELIETYRKALEAGTPFDLVIMDLTIPGGMGGKEAIRILKEYDSAARAIVSSGYSNDPIMAQYEEYGFSGMAQKPYQFNELRDEINRVMSQQKKRCPLQIDEQ